VRFWSLSWLLIAILLPAASHAQQAVQTQEANQSQEGEFDPWGAKRSFGMAAGELIISNMFAWAFNEFPRKAAFSQINPSSWLHNFQEGMGWDDNHFSTNQFAHPYQGGTYFNAARANGHSFWEAAPWTFAGSLMWECCGETHLMSANDFINTGMGGIALGEMLYRTSSMVLDNTSTGWGRVGREIAGFALDPIRGLNRLITGRASRVYDNPANSLDQRPSIFSSRLFGGVRGFSENAGFTDTEYRAFLNFDLQYGSPFQIERNQPFEFFLLSAQINFGDKKKLGKLSVHANLYHRDIGESEKHRHRFMILQHFDYANNIAYEFGGQSIGLGVISAWELGEPGNWGLFTMGEGLLSPMAAVNSDFAFAAEIPGTRENLRDYDFGLGAGVGAGMALIKNGERIVDLAYYFTYVNTLNGSVKNGSDAGHLIHSVLARVDIPVSRAWAVGADYELFLRNSYYSGEEFEDTVQKSPLFRVFAIWKLGSWGPTGFGG
jgi:hypothetical protein